MKIGEIQKTIDRFNMCFQIGAQVAYYPGRYDDDTIIHRNGKRTTSKTMAFAHHDNTVCVYLEGVGNCDVRNIVSGKTCSLDPVGFDKDFEHRW
jgi:hypothetical protein